MTGTEIREALDAAKRSLRGIYSGKRYPDRAAWALSELARDIAADTGTDTDALLRAATRYEAALNRYRPTVRELRNAADDLMGILDAFAAAYQDAPDGR